MGILAAAHDEAALVGNRPEENPRAERRDATLKDASLLHLHVVAIGNLLQRCPIGQVVTQPPPLPRAVHAA